MEPSIYDYLSKQTVAELTIANLNSATKLTNLDPVNIEFWQGVITLNRVLQDSRTFPHGLPVPETGAVEIVTIADGASATIKPAGSEIWRVQSIDVDNCTMAFMDADGNISPISPEISQGSLPFMLSLDLFLAFSNGTGSEQTPSIAFHKVAL